MQETVMEVICEHRWTRELPATEVVVKSHCMICGTLYLDGGLNERVVIGRVEEVVKEVA